MATRPLVPAGQQIFFTSFLEKEATGRIKRYTHNANKPSGLTIRRPIFDETISGFENYCRGLNEASYDLFYALTSYDNINDQVVKDPVAFAALLCSAIMEPFVGHLEAGRIYEYFRNNVASSFSNTPPPGATNPPTVQSSTNAIKAALASQHNSNPFLGLIPKGKATVTGIDRLGGCVCKKCNTSNEYAAPNQDDGTYICFGCR